MIAPGAATMEHQSLSVTPVVGGVAGMAHFTHVISIVGVLGRIVVVGMATQ